MKIFLSAVSSQFEHCRNQLASDLRAVDAEVVVQKDFPQQGRTLLEKLEGYIAGCDRLIALVGDAYGWEPDRSALPPDRPRRSYTQWEYFFAQGERLDGTRQDAKQTFVYFASPEFLNLNRVSEPADAVALQQTFVDYIRTSGQEYSSFGSLHELRACVLRDIPRIADRKPAPPPSLFTERIQNFLDEYLGSPTSVVPFGGRLNEFEALDTWLEDSKAPPYAMIATEAGRGKSALLVRWTRKLRDRDAARVVFIPVSIGFNTALSSVTFPALADGLSTIFGETASGAELSAEQWRSICLGYMMRSPPDGKPLLVVLDGLDEASDWQPGVDLFPVSPPPGLRVLASARYVAGDVDERGWLRRLGWDNPSRARSIPVPPLSRQGVSEVLASMGDPLGQLVTQADLVSELFRLTQGDPLLVRLYVEALRPHGAGAVALRPADLPSIRAGLVGYFERWWDEQGRRAKSLGRAALAQSEDVRNFFNVCATALGPLSRDDVAAIAGGSLGSGLRLKDIAGEVDRFVVGDGSAKGYVFSHPRLGQFFLEQMTAAERAKWTTRFLEYGRQVLAALDKGQLAPGETSHYIIQHHGEHLERAGAPDSEFYALVTAGWLRAWEALEGTYAGFLNDTERAWGRAESAFPRDAVESITVPFRCALCRSSVIALSANIPPDLLVRCVQDGVLTPVQALTIARQTHDRHRRREALTKLTAVLPPDLRAEAVQEALAIARADKDMDRVNVLTAPAAAETHRETVPGETSIGVSRHLSEKVNAEATRQALSAARVIDDELPRLRVLVALTPSLPQSEMLVDVLKAVLSIRDRRERMRLLIDLARVPGELKSDVLAKALATARELPESGFMTSPRAVAIRGLAPHLFEGLQADALQMARAMRDDKARASALIGVARGLLAEQKTKVVQEALQASLKIGDAQQQAFALVDIVGDLPEPERPDIAQKALDAARRSTYAVTFASVVKRLAPHVSEARRTELLSTTLPNFDDELLTEVLTAWAPNLSTTLLRQAKGLLGDMKDGDFRAAAVAGLAPYPPDTHAAQKAFEGVLEIRSRWIRSVALAGLVPHLPDGVKTKAIQEAFRAMTAIREKSLLEDAQKALAPLLPEWAAAHRGAAYSVWKETLRAFSSGPRPAFLSQLQMLLPFTLSLVGEGEKQTTAVGVFQAVQNVGTWWP